MLLTLADAPQEPPAAAPLPRNDKPRDALERIALRAARCARRTTATRKRRLLLLLLLQLLLLLLLLPRSVQKGLWYGQSVLLTLLGRGA